MENLLTSSEARALLGNMSPSSFKELVDSKRIRKVVPPGKVQGKYVRADVEKIAAELRSFIESKKTPRQPRRKPEKGGEKKGSPGATDWAQSEDLPYMLAYDYQMYGVDNTV